MILSRIPDKINMNFSNTRLNRSLHFPVPEAVLCMVIDHSGRLHESVTYSRTDEFKPPFFQVFAHGVGFRRCRGHPAEAGQGIIYRFTAGELPYIFVKSAEFLFYGKITPWHWKLSTLSSACCVLCPRRSPAVLCPFLNMPRSLRR